MILNEEKAVEDQFLNDYEDRMLEAFIQKPEKVFWYKSAFSKFNINGIHKAAWVWSWWAFIGSFWYLLYRKAYMPALALFGINFIASLILSLLGSLIVSILAGGYSVYYVHKTYKERKTEIEATISDTEKRIETMRLIGGYNEWVIWVSVIFVVITFLAIIALFSQ